MMMNDGCLSSTYSPPRISLSMVLALVQSGLCAGSSCQHFSISSSIVRISRTLPPWTSVDPPSGRNGGSSTVQMRWSTSTQAQQPQQTSSSLSSSSSSSSSSSYN